MSQGRGKSDRGVVPKKRGNKAVGAIPRATEGSVKWVSGDWHSYCDSSWLMLGLQFRIPTSSAWNGLDIQSYITHVNYFQIKIGSFAKRMDAPIP